MSQSRQICTFHIDNLLLGIDVGKVQEVLKPQHLTRVPLAPRSVKGLINLRGHIVTAIDMRDRMDLPAAEDERGGMNVVICEETGMISLLVDRVGDVLKVDDSKFEQTPNTLPPSTGQLIRRTYKLDHRLLLELDTRNTLQLAQEADRQ